MNQTASWNRLEILLNETTPKKSTITPKSASKLDDGSQPRLLKCLRSKKGFKGLPTLKHLPSSHQLIRYGDTPTSAREKIFTDPIDSQTKSNNEVGTGIFVTLKEMQKGSLEDIEQYSDFSDCEKNLFATGAYEDNEIGSEAEIRGLEARKFSSVGAIKSVPPARCTEWQRKQNFVVCQPFVENGVTLKRYKPLCGIPDAQIRELYRLKCQDLNIGVFADSEESFLQGAKKKSTDDKLCLFESGFGPKAIEKLAQILQNNCKISQLSLRKSVLNGESMRVLAKSLALMPSLIHLELANNSIEPEDFIILFEELAASKTLVSIDISNYEADRKNRLTVECLDAFHTFAKRNILLQYVKFVNLMLEDEVVQRILSALEGSPNLLSLNLSSNNFTGKALEGLPSVLAKTELIQFDLSNNKLRKEGAMQVAKAIQNFKGANREGLELVLENAHLGADINLIFGAFGRDTNVAKLNFSQNILSNVELMKLEYALGINTKLAELNLSNCRLGQMGGRMLARGLEKNKTLQSLILVHNDLNDEIGSQIILSLINNHSFKSLDMSQNHLSSKSAQAVQDMVKKNSNVHKYNLSLNKFNEKEGYLLQEVLYFNSKIVQFNLHHNPVKYNTIETIERILKDNQRKLLFEAVPKLKDELAKKKTYIEDEKHAVGEAVEMERVKIDVKKDVERFQETLVSLKNRTESPNMKKNEKVVIKQSKELRVYAKEYSETVLKTRDFTDEAFLEAESYKNELMTVEIQIQQAEQKLESKKRDIEDMKKKYEPEIKRLRYEISKLKEENNFIELYNDTLTQKIKKEKKKINAANQAVSPKISDMFLATSELARHKKKHNEVQEKALESTKSRIGGLEAQSHLSHISEEKVAKEYNFAVQNQKLRINKQVKSDSKIKRKNPTKTEAPDQENVKERIKERIKNLLNETSGPVGSILGQIADN